MIFERKAPISPHCQEDTSLPKMGLREISLVLLAAGASLAIVGGLGACCYNLRFFSKNTVYMNQWGGFTLKSGLQSAMASGILGLVCALVALVALVLLIIGFNKMIVSILFIVSAVLYLGELIPEAVFLAKYQYLVAKSVYGGLESVTYDVPPKSGEVSLDGEEAKWATTVAGKWEEQKTKYVTECAKEPGMNEGICQTIVNLIETQFKSILGTDAVFTGAAWIWSEDGKLWSQVSDPTSSSLQHYLFVPDFVKTKYPDAMRTGGELKESDCDTFDVAIAEYKGGWSSKTVTKRVVSQCKKAFKSSDEKAESKDEQSDAQGKRSRDMARVYQYESAIGVWVANTIMIGIQTFAFAVTLGGVILSFVAGGSKDDPEP